MYICAMYQIVYSFVSMIRNEWICMFDLLCYRVRFLHHRTTDRHYAPCPSSKPIMRLRNIPFDNNNNISGSGFAHVWNVIKFIECNVQQFQSVNHFIRLFVYVNFLVNEFASQISASFSLSKILFTGARSMLNLECMRYFGNYIHTHTRARHRFLGHKGRFIIRTIWLSNRAGMQAWGEGIDSGVGTRQIYSQWIIWPFRWWYAIKRTQCVDWRSYHRVAEIR